MRKAEFDKSINATHFYLKNKLPEIHTEQNDFISNILELNYNLLKKGFFKSNGRIKPRRD